MNAVHVNRAVIVGIFIFLGLVIFTLAVFTIGNQGKTFEKTVAVNVVFEDVSGLQPGNNVWLSGVKIGTVKKMSFRGIAQVEVVMHVDRDAQQHIRKDAKAKISSDGFIGNRIVVIYGGTDAAPNISSGDYLQSEKSVIMDDVVATLQKNNINLLAITANLRDISDNIKNGKGTVGTLINDPAAARSLQATLDHFRAAAFSSQKAIGQVGELIAGFTRPGTLVHELQTDTSVFATMRQALGRLNDASQHISEFADSLRMAGTSLGRTDNPAGVILHDQQVAADLKTITHNLTQSSEKLEEDLTALQHNFLLRSYFKKEEKQAQKQPSANGHPSNN
jgi:phospholipid/cholesterol/gamma-HCH transport system substrate-binding protein